jgi:asparagine synthase (glutamine-hydrolysing)
MCGIAGAFAFEGSTINRAAIQPMGDSMAHRGPDDDRYLFWSAQQGYELYRHSVPPSDVPAQVGFAHRRLSIIDISSGHQPMPNEDNTVWICFNGEIYNYLELRQQLIAAGHVFRTNSDTETIIHLYEECGADGIAQLNGMFAFALWDGRKREMLLARDRYGIKPLYYTVQNNTLLFGSEIKAIVSYPGVPRKVNPQALAEHFTFQNHFGEKTFFQDIHLLEAGHWQVYRADGTLTTRQYWQMQFAPELTDEKMLVDALRSKFEKAVHSQLMSEVPVGSYLSGGMDTGSITAVAARHLPGLHTFTCGFDLPANPDELEQYFDESAAAWQLADVLKTQHHEIRLNHTHNFPALPAVIWALDEPRLGISYQNWYTARLIRQHVTVVLSGAGGDELFAGYVWRHSAAINTLPLNEWNLAYYRQWIRFLDDEQKHDLFSDSFNQHISGFSTYDSFLNMMQAAQTTDPLERALYFDAHTFMHGLLIVEDKLGMAHSIEARVPLLDNDVVDLTLRIPSALKLKNGTGKAILRQAMQGLLPDDTLTRRKQGFTPPDASWYRGELRGEVENLLLNDRTLSRGYFKPEKIRQIVDDHMTGRHNHRFFLWSLLTFEWWNRLFLDGDSVPAVQV